MIKKINVSVSGLGVGEKHAKHIKDNINTNLVSIFDNNLRKKIKKAEDLNTKYTKTFKELSLNKNCDLVIIASPDHAHYNQIIQSLKNKKHIFIEKPICNNIRELKKIVTEWKKNKNKIKIKSNLILRSSPLFLWLKKKIKQDYFGEIYSIDVEYLYGRLHKFTNGWRGHTKGYSPMNGGGIHMIDLACWLVNQLPDEVVSNSNNLATRKYGLKSKDFMCSTLNFKSGLILRAASNLACVFRHQHTIKIYGSKKTFIYDDLGPRVYNSRNTKKKFKKINLKSLPSNKINILKNFIRDIAEEKNIIKGTLFDLRIMNILCYCNISSKTSKKHKIKYII